MEYLAFAASAALAQLLTNLDNLAVLLTLVLSSGPHRPVAAYAIAQTGMLVLSTGVALGLSGAMPQGWVGYLGLVPVALGVTALIRRWTGGGVGDAAPAGSVSLPGLVALFAGLSFDSFSVMAPLLTDSGPAFRLAALIGALLSVAGIGGLALRGARVTARLAVRFERLGPWAMIAAGFYVLANTGTDTV